MALVKAGKCRDAGTPIGETTPDDHAAADPLAWLDDADPARRRRAARDLAGRADAVAALAGRLAREGDASVREALLTALARTGTEEAADALVPLLGSEDAALRNGAAESLEQMPPAVVLSRVAPLLDDPDSDRRIFAALLLGRLPLADRLPSLTQVVERDPHVNVCLAALDALVESGLPEILPSLERLAARFPDDAFVAFSVDAARRRFTGG